MSTTTWMKDIHFTSPPFNWVKGEHPIDKLLKHFKDTQLWDPKTSESHWHAYRLPSIEISDDTQRYYGRTTGLSNGVDPLFDVLGCYKHEEPEREGVIVLYREYILKQAECYIKEVSHARAQGREEPWMLDLTLEEAFVALSTVVFYHELGHWVFHVLPPYNGAPFKSIHAGYTPEDKVVHEAIAQAVAELGIGKSQEQLALFNYLLKGLPEGNIYRGHEVMRTLDPGYDIRHLIFAYRMVRSREGSNSVTTLEELYEALKDNEMEAELRKAKSRKLSTTYCI